MLDDLFTPADQRLLDRLVDGELNETERADLLRRIERAPDGWRCCALAFLEAQAWRQEARALVTEPVANVAPPAGVRPSAPAAWRNPMLWMPAATAAAVVFGWVLYVAKFDRAGHEVAGVDVPRGGGAVVVEDARPAAVAAGQVATEQIAAAAPGAERQNLQLVVERGPNGEPQVIEVPLVGIQNLNEALLGQWSQSLSPEMVRMLEQSGNQIVRRRQLVPVDLRDGRRVVVPMDQVEIVPVSNRFQ